MHIDLRITYIHLLWNSHTKNVINALKIECSKNQMHINRSGDIYFPFSKWLFFPPAHSGDHWGIKSVVPAVCVSESPSWRRGKEEVGCEAGGGSSPAPDALSGGGPQASKQTSCWPWITHLPPTPRHSALLPEVE